MNDKPEDLAKALGATVVIKVDFSPGLPGMLEAAEWFSRRQEQLRKEQAMRVEIRPGEGGEDALRFSRDCL